MRLRAAAVALVVAAGLLLTGCGSSACEEYEEWQKNPPKDAARYLDEGTRLADACAEEMAKEQG